LIALSLVNRVFSCCLPPCCKWMAVYVGRVEPIPARPKRRQTWNAFRGEWVSDSGGKPEQMGDVRETIFSEIMEIAADQTIALPPLNDDLSLNETGLDSLCFAILVARLEDDLDVDPFVEEVSFPVTVGDLIKAYEQAARDRRPH
jgi:acyl carrier protein